MYNSTELTQSEIFVRRIAGEVLLGESSCYPKVFDCPTCDHETLSESRQVRIEDRLLTVRYCFGCGNTFRKEVSWKKEGKK